MNVKDRIKVTDFHRFVNGEEGTIVDGPNSFGFWAVDLDNKELTQKVLHNDGPWLFSDDEIAPV